MREVIRHDRGTLRKPRKTPQGFMRYDGHVARAGIYEYLVDGKISRELRPHEELHSPETLASYDSAPVTIEHPADEDGVTADNVRRHEVGSVAGAAHPDGDYTAAEVVVKDAKAIKLVNSGKSQLSPGTKCLLDETPGEDRRYAYPGNPSGRYDAVQRMIRVNHLAICDTARGGPTIRLRTDAADRADSNGKLTSVVNGHQHLIDLDPQYGSRYSGCTTCSLAEGADEEHSHDWVRNPDGSYTIGVAAGHTHAILEASGVLAPEPLVPPMPRYDTNLDRGRAARDVVGMTTEEQIRSLKEQLAAAEAKLGPLAADATAQTARADSAAATIVTLQGEIANLRAQIAAAAQVVETEAIKREKVRADSAEAALRNRDAEFDAALEKRVALERTASVIMPELNMRGLKDRDIVATVVKRLDAQQDTSTGVTDAYLRGRFDSLVDLHGKNARSLSRLSDAIVAQDIDRRDSVEEKRKQMREWGTEPLPNSREAQERAMARRS